MKISKVETFKTTARLKGIEETSFKSKNGTDTDIIMLKTDSGTFTNFKSVWEKQHIDVEQLDEGDKLEIRYSKYVNQSKGRTFKNFITVDVVEDA